MRAVPPGGEPANAPPGRIEEEAASAGRLNQGGLGVSGGIAAVKRTAAPPAEPYKRRLHYGNTPTPADRAAIGGESVDHDLPLVQRYYEGDAARGEKPGYQQTAAERRTSANDRSRMKPSTKQAQNRQGAQMSHYSKRKKKEHGFL
jgi:hypothetical protein